MQSLLAVCADFRKVFSFSDSAAHLNEDCAVNDISYSFRYVIPAKAGI